MDLALPENKNMIPKIILASGSPRRKEIFENLGLDFKVISADIDETTNKHTPHEIVMDLSKRKAREVYKNTGGLVVAADTIVWLEGNILNKPKDPKDAKNMLKMLSGTSHEVYTGVCIINEEKTITDFCKTTVFFKTLRENEIDAYIETREPLDKAGAYNIGGLGALFVQKIEGDFFNVVGFPINLFYGLIWENFGYNII